MYNLYNSLIDMTFTQSFPILSCFQTNSMT